MTFIKKVSDYIFFNEVYSEINRLFFSVRPGYQKFYCKEKYYSRTKKALTFHTVKITKPNFARLNVRQ